MKPAGFAIALLAALSIAAPAAAESKIVKLETRPGVSVEFRFIGSDDATAALVLFEGGGGTVNLRSAAKEKGFVARHRDGIARQGFAVALVHAPPDQKGFKGGMPPKFRGSKKHLQDIDAVVAWMKEKTKLPVWAVGISAGTASAVHYAARGGHPLEGVVLLSSITDAGSGKAHKSILELGLDRVRVPVLVLAHEKDGCHLTSASGAARVVEALSASPRAEAKILAGGQNVGRDPCGTRTYHTFYKMEDEAISTLADFIKANAGTAAAPTAQSAPAGGPLSGVEIERLLVGNTIVYPAGKRGSLYTYFEPGGTTFVAFQKTPGRVLNKTWWIKDGGLLCRTLGKENRENCAKIAEGGGGTLKFLAPNGTPRFEATLLDGRQLPK